MHLIISITRIKLENEIMLSLYLILQQKLLSICKLLKYKLLIVQNLEASASKQHYSKISAV